VRDLPQFKRLLEEGAFSSFAPGGASGKPSVSFGPGFSMSKLLENCTRDDLLAALKEARYQEGHHRRAAEELAQEVAALEELLGKLRPLFAVAETEGDG
jgi:hypothetical protein